MAELAPDDNPVDEDEGLAIPRSEEEAKAEPVSEEVHEHADAVAADETVEGSTEIGGMGGGPRFFGAKPPA